MHMQKDGTFFYFYLKRLFLGEEDSDDCLLMIFKFILLTSNH